MKRILSMLLIVVIVTTFFIGCSNEKETVSTDTSKTESGKGSNEEKTANGESVLMDNGVKISKPGEFPIVEEEITLTVMMEQHVNVSDYEINKMTQRVEELTGINIEWQLVSSQDREQKINLLLATNSDLPDVFMGSYISPGLQMTYGSQGIFLPMNDMIEEHGVEIKRVMGLEADYEKLITSEDGNIYGLPKFSDQINTKASVKAWVYTPWLDALGLEKPTTTDELYTVLKAFKEEDPNGNGIADEIPMMGATNGWNQQPQRFLMNAFTFYDESGAGLYVEDGTIGASYVKEEFKEGLYYMKKLVSEGLLDVTSWTQDRNQLKQLVESDVAIVGSVTSGSVHVFSNINGERAKGFDTIEPLEGPGGTKISWFDKYWPYQQGQYVITDQCEYPIVALKLADALMSEELSIWGRYGEPNVDYIVNPEGEVDMDGNPATFKPVLEWGSVQNAHWQNLSPSYLSIDFLKTEAAGDPFGLNIWLNRVSLRDYYPNITDNKVPPIVMSEEMNEESMELQTTLTNYYKESMTRFILGDLDIDKDWDSYVEELKFIGLERFIEITQQAYDTKWK